MTNKSILLILASAFFAGLSSFTDAQPINLETEKAACPRLPRSESEKNSCEALTKKYPQEPDFYFNIGNYYYGATNNKNTARIWFERGIQTRPDYYRSYIVKALLATLDEDHDKAIAELGKAIALNPKDAKSFINRCSARFPKGGFREAIDDCSEAIRLEPKNEEARRTRGYAWYKLREYDKAFGDYNEALTLDPRSATALRLRASVWRKKKNYERAFSDLNEAIRLEPKNATHYSDRANVWADKQSYDKAIADFTEALRLDPKLSTAYNDLGETWRIKGDKDKAIFYLNDAIQLNPKNPTSFINRGNAWAGKSVYDKAITDFNEALKLGPDESHFYASRGYMWVNKGDYDKAISDFNEVIKLNPIDTFAFYNRGIAWNKKGDYDRAIADYTETLRLEPGNANAKEKLQFALEKKQKSEKAVLSADTKQQPALPTPATSGRRIALVIGNGAYKNVGTLANPPRDAELLAQTLRDVGFDTVAVKLNLNRNQMMTELKEFEKRAAEADWAAIYFAGHGIEVSGTNYLLPTDAEVTAENSVAEQTVNLEYLLNSVEVASKLRLVVLDACRNNPFAQQVRIASAARGVEGLGASTIGRGLGRVEPQPGTLVVYAAKHGEFALDGENKNSPFVESLVKRISQKPPLEVRRLFDFVRQDVFSTTKKEQQPFAYGSLDAGEDFYFSR